MTTDTKDGGGFDPDDPNNLRPFSILPPEDENESHCVRHSEDMNQMDTILHSDGSIYASGDGFTIYTCVDCLKEIGVVSDYDPIEYYKWQLHRVFDKWESGDAPEDMFSKIGTGSLEDIDGKDQHGNEFLAIESDEVGGFSDE